MMFKMITVNMTFAKEGVSVSLMKFVVKSNSPMSMAKTFACQNYDGKVIPMTTKHNLDEAVIEGSKGGGSGQKVFLIV